VWACLDAVFILILGITSPFVGGVLSCSHERFPSFLEINSGIQKWYRSEEVIN
jgi:hypothetical protein